MVVGLASAYTPDTALAFSLLQANHTAVIRLSQMYVSATNSVSLQQLQHADNYTTNNGSFIWDLSLEENANRTEIDEY